MTPIVTIAILIITGAVTMAAFRRPELKQRLIFSPYEILHHKQFERLLTPALIHADWMHFAFNAFTLYCFGKNIELFYGAKTLLFIYLSSILGGGILSLLIHRRHEYQSLGASGGVCGVLFASIFLLPGGSITLFPLPVGVPAYLYAIAFLVYSFVAHRRQRDNIGHDAHMGGAIIGLVLAAMVNPGAVEQAPWMFLAALGVAVTILCLLIFDPGHFLEQRFHFENRSPGDRRAREYDANRELNEKKAEIDRLLDKVSQRGMDKLSRSERKRLDALSKAIYGRKL
jgi:membrane associated rhomboid family serine protease